LRNRSLHPRAPAMSDTVLYLSPHFDDVVFSCPLNLLRESKKGREAIVATFFTEGDQSKTAGDLYDTRNAENNEALSLLGVKGHSVGLIDAPSREPGFKTFPQIVLSEPDSDPETLVRIKEELQSLLVHFAPVEIIAPLGVGTHIDHLLIHEAITSLEGDVPPLRFYEDYPYASVAGAFQLRVAQLGIALPVQIHELSWPDFEDAFFLAKYVDQLLEAEDQDQVIEELENQWRHPPAVTRRMSCHELSNCSLKETSRTAEAANAYRSQLDTFFDVDRKREAERLWKIES
ncbi:MAG: PIG-L family deacetylase, partial [Verrucomicrobiales bacterium]|nr:PIG-L family deacetylase [Verrucomicrobiales bacterium]